MAKLDELYDADTASDLFMEVTNEGDYIYEEEYGYESDRWAFDNEDEHFPAYVLVRKYKEKYYVYIDYIENEYPDYPEVFDELEPAYELFKTLIHTGIPSGKIQIENCKKQLIEPDLIDIQCESTYSNCIWFRVYYGGDLLMEHLSGLYADEINAAIKEYKDFCKRYNIQIWNVSKIRPWNSNQRYYKIEFSNGEETLFHIPSVMQGQKRTVVSLIKKNNIVKKAI